MAPSSPSKKGRPKLPEKPLQRLEDAAIEWLFGKVHKDRYSVQRLKFLYTELVEYVDADQRGRRQAPKDVTCGDNGEPSIASSALSPSILNRRRIRKELSSTSTSAALGLNGHASDPHLDRKKDLYMAFRILSATPAPFKEGHDGGALTARDANRSLSDALSRAKRMEQDVIEIVRSIGEVVAFGDDAPGNHLRSDEVFEFFAEKDMVLLLIEIAKAQPSGNTSMSGVTWSPLVKAQVLQTLAILVSNAQDQPSLYYLLSKHGMNELVSSFLPLRQWTDTALEVMLPVYVGLLKGLAQQLASTPQSLGSMLIWENEFPLFTAATNITTSPQSDSYSRQSSLHLLISIMQVDHASVQDWICSEGATADQDRITTYFSQRLLERLERLVKLTSGPVVDPARSRTLTLQLTDLQDQIQIWNNVFFSPIRTMHVRLCECLMRQVVAVLLQYLLPTDRKFVPGLGLLDLDVIPQAEARAQSATLILTNMFLSLKYPPLIRMMAVALLHPVSTKEWHRAYSEEDVENYVLTKALNRIVQENPAIDDVRHHEEFVPNPFRAQILSILSGDLGEWMLVPVTMLLESILTCEKVLDTDTLKSLGIIPSFEEGKPAQYPESPLEEALAIFLEENNESEVNSVSVMALERCGALATAMLVHICQSMSLNGQNPSQLIELIPLSPAVRALRRKYVHLCSQALSTEQKTGVSELFVDLTQFAIRSRYSKLSEQHDRHSRYGCNLQRFVCHELRSESEILVRKFRVVITNDVEEARYFIQLALHYRALCHLVYELLWKTKHTVEQKARMSSNWLSFGTIDWADELLLTIADVKEKPAKGQELNLRGRMIFRFHAASNRFERHPKPSRNEVRDDRRRALPDELSLPPSSHLILVLDPTDIFVVKPVNRSDVQRGTIVCAVSLRSIIAFAPDDEWLHIAIRNLEDIGYLVKGGNMALRFESEGACLIVRRYLENSQLNLRNELKERIGELFMSPKEEEPVKEEEEDKENGSAGNLAKKGISDIIVTDDGNIVVV